MEGWYEPPKCQRSNDISHFETVMKIIFALHALYDWFLRSQSFKLLIPATAECQQLSCLVVRASASGAAKSGLIPSRVKPTTLLLEFIPFPLDVQH